MKAKILGVSPYITKEGGKHRAYVYCQDLQPNNPNLVGILTKAVNCSADVLPMPAEEMIGKTFIIDTDGGFGNGFYKV